MALTRTRWPVIGSSFVAISFLAGNAHARQDVAEIAVPSPEVVQPSTACAQVFGYAHGRKRNQRRRNSWLDAIARTGRGYSVESRIPLRRPRPVTFRGLTLQRIEVQNGRKAAAIVRYQPPAGNPSKCRSGLYTLHVDDSIGSGNSVVGIVENAVLIRRRNELVYLEMPESVAVQWRMIWHSRWRVWVPKPPRLPAPRSTRAPAPRPPPPPAKPRR